MLFLADNICHTPLYRDFSTTGQRTRKSGTTYSDRKTPYLSIPLLHLVIALREVVKILSFCPEPCQIWDQKRSFGFLKSDGFIAFCYGLYKAFAATSRAALGTFLISHVSFCLKIIITSRMFSGVFHGIKKYGMNRYNVI